MQLLFHHIKSLITTKYLFPVLFAFVFQFADAQDEEAEFKDTVIVEEQKEVIEEKVEIDGQEQGYFLKKYALLRAEDSVMLRNVPDSVLNRLKKSGSFWYANYVFNKKEQEKKERIKSNSGNTNTNSNSNKNEYETDDSNRTEVSSSGSVFETSWFSTLMWIIIIGSFIGAIGWYLSTNDTAIFRKRNTVVAPAAEDDTMPDDIFAINYQKELDRASAVKDYRLAIRLMYLRLLKSSAEKNIIQYAQERTNFDYLLQMHKTSYYNDFFRLTRNFEYAWYGKFTVSDEAFDKIKNDFDNFNNKIG
jgi:hypothetical protein